MRAIGYTRVSTAEQKRKDGGLEAQRRAIRATCKERGWELLRVEEDTGSGGKVNSKLKVTLQDLGPGESESFRGSIRIEDEGALRVQRVEVTDCDES